MHRDGIGERNNKQTGKYPITKSSRNGEHWKPNGKKLKIKQITNKPSGIQTALEFSTETMKAWRLWGNVFKLLKENTFPPGILY